MKNKRNKLSDADVYSIRQSYESGGMSQQTLAKVYGVSQAQISRIIAGRQRQKQSSV